jgi:hypothetical protein
VEDGLHQSTVQSRTRIDGRNDHARCIHKGTESCVAGCRGIELRAAVRIRMDAKYRLSQIPGNDGRFECAGRRFDMRFSYPCCTPDASISAARSTS